MDYNNIPDVPLPLPPRRDIGKPVLITKDYYETLSEEEKARYEPINIKEETK